MSTLSRHSAMIQPNKSRASKGEGRGAFTSFQFCHVYPNPVSVPSVVLIPSAVEFVSSVTFLFKRRVRTEGPVLPRNNSTFVSSTHFDTGVMMVDSRETIANAHKKYRRSESVSSQMNRQGGGPSVQPRWRMRWCDAHSYLNKLQGSGSHRTLRSFHLE